MDMRFIASPKFFPTVLIIIDVLAALGYARVGNWKKAVYWIAAGTLSYTVTW